MFTVYSGGGAQDYRILDESTFAEDHWNTLRRGAEKLLDARGDWEAAELLRALPFVLYEGENFFGDDFAVLLARLPIETYVEYVDRYSNQTDRQNFKQMAAALNEICPAHVRFIGFDTLLEDGLPSVPEPPLRVSNRTVEEALAGARQLISARGSTSGVDRVHTALHGYLHQICKDAGIEVAESASLTVLFRALRSEHPSLEPSGPRSEDVTRVLRALATIVDVLNPLRNETSLAHPNPELLDEAEADLVLNSIHTLLHWLNRRL